MKNKDRFIEVHDEIMKTYEEGITYADKSLKFSSILLALICINLLVVVIFNICSIPITIPDSINWILFGAVVIDAAVFFRNDYIKDKKLDKLYQEMFDIVNRKVKS
jgi:hypothetical protein